MRKILEDNVIPLDKLMVETDAPFMVIRPVTQNYKENT